MSSACFVVPSCERERERYVSQIDYPRVDNNNNINDDDDELLN